MLNKVQMTDYSRNIHIEAYTDGYAYDEYSQIYLFSAVGHDSSVKAITAGLVSNRTIEIVRNDEVINVSAPWYYKNRIMSSRLQSGMLHQLVISELFFSKEHGSILIYIPEGERVDDIVFNTLKARFSVPALPEWAGWIFKRLKEEEALEELSGNIRVLRLTTNEEHLDTMISEGIKSDEISFFRKEDLCWEKLQT